MNLFENVSTEINVNVVPDEESKQLNKQMEEVSKLITKEENVLDPSFEDVLAAAEENIQSSNIDDSENAPEKTNQEVEESKETQE